MDLSSARQAINGLAHYDFIARCLTHREKITTNDLSEFFSADVTVREKYSRYRLRPSRRLVNIADWIPKKRPRRLRMDIPFTAPSPADAAVPTQSHRQSHSAPSASDYPQPAIARSAFPSL